MIQLAKGRYFVQMDADDVMHPERLERQYSVLSCSGEDTVVGSSAYSISATSELIGFRRASGKQHTGFAARHSFFHPTVAASVTWFRSHPYTERPVYSRSEDAELWCRASETSEFVTIADPLLYYRELGAASVAGYIGSQTGILHLLCERYRRPVLPYVGAVSREVMKIWLAYMCEGLGRSEWMDRRRYQSLSPAEIPVALAGLDRVRAQELPRNQVHTARCEVVEVSR
jgi:hypothetical protein